MERILSGIAAVILVGQLVWIGHAHQNGAVYGNWAMYHTGINYQATASVDGVDLTAKEFSARYHIPAQGFNGRSLDHLTAILAGRELSYGERGEIVALRVRFAENGGEARDWTWRSGVTQVAAIRN